jgi:integrin beta 3
MRGGSLWRAYATTSNKPPDDGWKLMIRKGRDGKDGKDGKDAH